MKLSKKILALIMASVMMLSIFPAFASAEFTPGINGYMDSIMSGGIPILSTEDFGKILNVLKTFKYLITGEEAEPERIDITVDDFLSELSMEICKESGLDLELIVKNLPDINAPARYFIDKYEIDITEFRKARYAKRDEYLANDNPIMASVCHAIGAYMSLIKSCDVYTLKTDDPDIYEVEFRITYQDGTKETHKPGLIINKETGLCTNKEGTGMFGSGYNFSVKEMIVYTTVDCWMRNFGFCLFYDIAANTMPISYSYITRRFKFEYDGLEWMIQIWKGNYFISNGGEVGIYSREPEKSGTFYNCATDDQMLDMSMQIYHKDKLLVNRELQKHWWISGFHIGTARYLPSSLTLKTSIVMPDEEMLNAFTESIDNNVMGDVSYTVDGLTVSITW